MSECWKRSSFGEDFCGRHQSQDWPCPYLGKDLHECGYPEDSFGCRVRHVYLQTGWARRDH